MMAERPEERSVARERVEEEVDYEHEHELFENRARPISRRLRRASRRLGRGNSDRARTRAGSPGR